MKQRGFSLIEISITLVIFGFLLMSAMPNLTSWMRNAKLRSQAEAMQSGLQRARDEAVRRNRQITFWLITPSGQSFNSSCRVTTTGNSWVVSATSPDSACDTITLVPSGTEPAPRHLGTESGTTISISGTDSAGTTAASSVTFDGFGRVVTSATASQNLRRIFISHATSSSTDRSQRIDINSTGLVRACDTSVTSTSDPRYCPSTE